MLKCPVCECRGLGPAAVCLRPPFVRSNAAAKERVVPNEKTTMWEAAYAQVLPRVQRPSRYLGNEIGRVVKDPASVSLRFALAFPDLYEIGQSYPGLQILYDILNRRSDVYAERVFAPWFDMEDQLRKTGLPLVSLETFTPLNEFDIVGFTLQYELTYTNILCMLELGRIPLLSKERGADAPIVVGGGPCAFNPEPVADFFDAILLGDGEEAIHELCDAYLAWRGKGSRRELLEALAAVPGVYVPGFYHPRYNERGEFAGVELTHPRAPATIRKRVVGDLNAVPMRKTFIVPTAQIVHDRPAIEVMRGCVKGCRFCQAGYVYRPLRERDPRRVVEEALLAAERTGQEELSLLSLSTGDYSCINPVLAELMKKLESRQVAVSLPSTRVDALAPSLLEQIRRVRKTGFTLAPEAGSQRLRDLIQKEYQEEELLEAARLIFSLGWRHLKLYFMIGLPTETEEDLEAIVELCARVRAVAPRNAEVVASVSNFVPKPHTPFQWLQQVSEEELVVRQDFLRSRLAKCGVAFRYHDARLSVLEGIFSRGDRRLSRALVHGFRAGARFDGWHEQCRFSVWQEVFAELQIDPAHELRRRRLDEPLPWDHLHSGVTKEFLRRELAKAFEGTLTPDCSVQRCTYCGACDFKQIRNVDFHLFGAKAAEHRGQAIEHWASAAVGEDTSPASWEPRGWKKVHAPQLLPTGGVNKGAGRDAAHGTLAPRRSKKETAIGAVGNAEEWLGAEGEHRLAPAGNASQPGEGSFRYRLRYSKVGRAKFLGSLEVTNAFYRALRASRLPLVFTNGHHPLPRVAFGPAVPFAVESEAEYCDVFFHEEVPVQRLLEAINTHLPSGIQVLDAWQVPLRAPSLHASIVGFEYEFDLRPVADKLDLGAVSRTIQSLLENQELWANVENRNGNRQRNLREAIRSLQLHGLCLRAQLRITQQGGIRPAQLLDLCFPDLGDDISGILTRKTRTVFQDRGMAPTAPDSDASTPVSRGLDERRIVPCASAKTLG